MRYALKLLQSGFINGVDVALAEEYINNAHYRDNIRTTACSMALVNRFIKQYGEKEIADKNKIEGLFLDRVNEEMSEILM